MLQNLKVDIIYHLTNSDFEMEFNLCGCCRMRLLSDKTADRKALVAALSRAVGRSRIIIACGPLFSADGLISTVATAIGSKVATVDNAAYGINSGDAIEIIAGSTPLVTAEGYFGGCIIESGPQTIILLTENKALRKSLMQTLIHPYIEEMSMLPVKGKAVTQETPEVKEEIKEAQTEEESVDETTVEEAVFVPATVEILEEVSDQEEIEETEETEDLQESDAEEAEESIEQQPEEEEEVQDEAAETVEQEDADDEQDVEEETEILPEENEQDTTSELEYIADTDESDEREIPFVFDEEEQKQMQELSSKMSEAYGTMYIEPERVKHSHTDKYAASYTPTEENDSFLSDADYVSYKKSLYRKNLNVPIIILVAVLLLIIGILGYFLILQPRLQGVDTIEYLREIFDTVDRTVYV